MSDAESYVRTCIPHFHVCNGPRPGGHFIQKESSEVHDLVLEHVGRIVVREMREMTVWIARNGRHNNQRYHWDENCTRLGNAKNPDEMSLAIARRGRTPCGWCYGKPDLGENDWSFQRDLRREAEENA